MLALTFAGPAPADAADPTTSSATPAVKVNAASEPEPPEDPVAESPAPWVLRIVPRRNMWELGAFGGVFFAHRVHDLYDVDTLPHEKLAIASPAAGLRVAYFPIKMLGLEAEYSGAWARLRSNDAAAFVYGLRAHAILQLPLFRVVPFLLGGYGALGVRSPIENAVGSDIDAAGHWGAGVKVYVNRWLAVRLDGRHIMSAAAQQRNVVASHGEIQLGISVPLGWHGLVKEPRNEDPTRHDPI